MSKPNRPDGQDAANPAGGRSSVPEAAPLQGKAADAFPPAVPSVDPAFAGAIEPDLGTEPVNLDMAGPAPAQAAPASAPRWLPVAALLGGAALAMLGAWVIHQSDDPSAAVLALKREAEIAAGQSDARLKALEARAAALQDSQGKAVAAIEKRLKEAEGKLAGALSAPASLNAAPSPGQSDTSGLAAQLAALAARFEAGEPALQKSAAEVAAISDRAGKLEASLAAAGDRIGKIETDLAAPKSALQATETRIAAVSSSSAAAQLAIAQSLLTAAERGTGFAQEVAALENLGVDPAKLAPFKAAGDKGVPSLAALSAGLKQASPAMLDHPAPDPAKPAGWLDQIGASVSGLVEVRKEGEAARSDIAGQIALIDAALAKADLAGALALRAKLPPSAQASSQAWAEAAAARLAALEAGRALVSEAIAALAAKK